MSLVSHRGALIYCWGCNSFASSTSVCGTARFDSPCRVMTLVAALLMVATADAQRSLTTDPPADFSFRLSVSAWVGCRVTDTIDSTTQTYTRHFSVVNSPEIPHTVSTVVTVPEDLKQTLSQWVQ